MSKTTKVQRENINWFYEQPVDIKFEMVMNHFEMSRIMINQIFEEIIREKTGDRYEHALTGQKKYYRHGFNPGSVKLGDHKLPVEIPRIREASSGKCIPLPGIEKFKQIEEPNEEVLKKVLHGISTRDYKKVTEHLAESFGLSSSQVSREFKEQSEEAFKHFCERTYEDHNFVALLIDGKYLASEQMVVALGITDKGIKIPVGFIQTSSENSRAISQLLKQIINKKFTFTHGLLVIIDGSKGLHKAVTDVFGKKVVIQRCQWHKRENVLSYLSDRDKSNFKTKIQNAYREPDYQKAKSILMSIHKELLKINQNAANSLLEGIEETLTLHKLKVAQIFSRSLGTTNCIESLNSQMAKYVRNVKRWSNSNQRQRWVASALLELENNLNKIHNFKHLNKLQEAIKNQLSKKSLEKIPTRK
ncbi:MAG TPA: transposase [Candidatus Cloacimonas acidaminovorans]|jgi:transposase-like protein|nr:transposase [Bacteroidota bacterium]MBK7573310.1 transposase [Bacteroidota bacterium]MBK8585648.1 transposase [Bacteroidota bacterium]HNV63355.1 transposase [Candidatus Cloacimonas acidaminovorans]HQX97967.1 transposase [Chitinophagaceae bacterium]